MIKKELKHLREEISRQNDILINEYYDRKIISTETYLVGIRIIHSIAEYIPEED